MSHMSVPYVNECAPSNIPPLPLERGIVSFFQKWFENWLLSHMNTVLTSIITLWFPEP